MFNHDSPLKGDSHVHGQYQLSDRAPALEIAVGRCSLGKRIRGANPRRDLPGGDPVEDVPRAPQQFLAREQMVAETGTRQKERPLPVERPGVVRRSQIQRGRRRSRSIDRDVERMRGRGRADVTGVMRLTASSNGSFV